MTPITEDLPSAQAVNTIFGAYTADHPNVTFEYQVVPFEQFPNTLITRALADDAPEMVQWGHTTAQLAISDKLVAVDDFMARDGVKKEDYWQSLWAPVEWGDKTFGFPFTIDVRYMFVNDSLVDTIGGQVPVTWEDLEALGPLGQAASTVPLGMVINNGAFAIWGPVGGFLKSNEGDWLRINPDGTATAQLTEAPVVETIEFVKRLIDSEVTQPGILSEGYDEVTNAFWGETIAMYIQGNWLNGIGDDLREQGQVDFTPSLAHAPMKKRRGAISGGYQWQLTTSLSNPDVGWDVIKFFNQDENVEQGWPVSLPPAKSNMSLDRYASDDRTPFVAEVLEYADWPIPTVVGWFELLDVIWRNVLTGLSGQKTIAQALADGNAETQAVLDSGHNTQVAGG
jgi:multiple sugar transport system substrate-binding protein